jgi:hypothetical protein
MAVSGPIQSGSVPFSRNLAAALGHAAEQLQHLDQEHRNERLSAGVRQVGMPAGAAGAKDPIVVDADDGPDGKALGAL